MKLLGFFTFCLIFLAHNKYHVIKWMSTGWIICSITCIIELCGFISGTTDSSSEKIRESFERQRKVSRKVPSWKRKYVKLSVLLFFCLFLSLLLVLFLFSFVYHRCHRHDYDVDSIVVVIFPGLCRFVVATHVTCLWWGIFFRASFVICIHTSSTGYFSSHLSLVLCSFIFMLLSVFLWILCH